LSRVPCPNPDCDRPAKAGLLCGACQAELQRALDGVPEVLGDLDVTLSRQTSRMGRGGGGNSTPLQYDRRASESGYVLRSTLVGWVRVLQEARPEEWPDDTAQAMAAWLSARLERLVRHPAAGEAHGEITTAVRAAQRAVDRAPDRQFAGGCACGAALYAKPGATRVQCRECDAEPVEVGKQRDAMLASIADQLVTATQAADILTRLAAPLSAELVRQWGTRGRLAAHGRDVRGHPLYRVSDVRELLIEKLKREQRAKEKRERMAS
jgi:hypothetical protein